MKRPSFTVISGASPGASNTSCIVSNSTAGGCAGDAALLSGALADAAEEDSAEDAAVVELSDLLEEEAALEEPLCCAHAHNAQASIAAKTAIAKPRAFIRSILPPNLFASFNTVAKSCGRPRAVAAANSLCRRRFAMGYAVPEALSATGSTVECTESVYWLGPLETSATWGFSSAFCNWLGKSVTPS